MDFNLRNIGAQALRIIRRRSHYRQIFQGQSGDAVLADLKRFCRGQSTPIQVGSNGQTDMYATAILIGRQEVFNRIAQMINISDEQLTNLKEQAYEDQ